MTHPHSIKESILASSVDLDELANHLNSLDHQGRMAIIELWDKAVQKNLFELCKGRTVKTDDIVPHGFYDQQVIHHGKNSMPMFSSFQKRFAILSKDKDLENRDRASAQVIGYNEWSKLLVGLTTPGYYRGYEDAETGEFVVDYNQIPEQTLEIWPALMPNEARIGRFVFAKMVDRLRKVSNHVTIGRAFKKKPMSNWFILVRED